MPCFLFRIIVLFEDIAIQWPDLPVMFYPVTGFLLWSCTILCILWRVYLYLIYRLLEYNITLLCNRIRTNGSGQNSDGHMPYSCDSVKLHQWITQWVHFIIAQVELLRRRVYPCSQSRTSVDVCKNAVTTAPFTDLRSYLTTQI